MPKYFITKSRFINGQYVHAEPEKPAVIDVPKGTKVTKDMKPFDQGEPEKPKFTGPPLKTAAGPENKPVGVADTGKDEK